ncbi:beta-ketoacyl synthase N-terminal-like domain-containing protein, partial [Rhodomicrobium udaipurense]
MRRVVITGIGLVTPLGTGTDTVWSNILAGKSGARRVTDFEVSDLACQIGCFIPRGTGAGEFNPDDWMEPKEQRKVDDFIVFAISAADQALADAGWTPKTDEEQNSTGVLIGSGIGGLQGIEVASNVIRDKG